MSTEGSWCQISNIMGLVPASPKAWAPVHPSVPHPQHFIIFPAFWKAVTMDTAGGGEGLRVVDMNSPSPRHILVAIAVVMEAGFPPTHLISSRLLLSKESVLFWLINELLNLKNDINLGWMVPLSTGYFIYDFFDMVLNQKLNQSWELLFHHIVVGLLNNTFTLQNFISWPQMFHIDRY